MHLRPRTPKPTSCEIIFSALKPGPCLGDFIVAAYDAFPKRQRRRAGDLASLLIRCGAVKLA